MRVSATLLLPFFRLGPLAPVGVAKATFFSKLLKKRLSVIGAEIHMPAKAPAHIGLPVSQPTRAKPTKRAATHKKNFVTFPTDERARCQMK
jgi:hypothetical protein